MNNEMRKCKECGKLFQPKGREQYCSNIHYRPCPICGTPVIAKYLSDPPRRCANCKATNKLTTHARQLFDLSDNQSTDIVIDNQSSDEVSVSNPTVEQVNIDISSNTGDVRRFIGKDYRRGKGYLPDHIYKLSIEKDEYSYIISASYDYTDNKEVSITELFSSIISIDGHFQKLNSAE